jgi:tetratricopeptide (TPR) repeat protein
LKESGGRRDPDKLARAELAYRRALSLDPTVADPHLQLGHVLKLQGKTGDAEASYLRAFALDPSMPHPQQELRGLSWSESKLSELRGMLEGRIDEKTFDGSPTSGQSPAAAECITNDSEALKMHIDGPSVSGESAEIPIQSRLIIEGWALARSGSASLDFGVDGDRLGSANYGLPRWDVAKAHPGWPNAENSGFIIDIPGRSLPKGRHALRLTLHDNSGNRKEVGFWINVTRAKRKSFATKDYSVRN